MNTLILECNIIQSMINVNESVLFYSNLFNNDNIALDGFNDITVVVKKWFLELLQKIKSAISRLIAIIIQSTDQIYHFPSIEHISTWINSAHTINRTSTLIWKRFESQNREDHTSYINDIKELKEDAIRSNNNLLKDITRSLISKNKKFYYKFFNDKDLNIIKIFENDMKNTIDLIKRTEESSIVSMQQYFNIWGEILSGFLTTLVTALNKSKYNTKDNLGEINIGSFSIDSLLILD